MYIVITTYTTQPIKILFPLSLVTVVTNKLVTLTIVFLQCIYIISYVHLFISDS